MTGSKTQERYPIRCAKADDYDAIVAVWCACDLHYRPKGRDSREAYCRQIRAFPSAYLVAVDGDRVIGVVFGTHDGRKGWINRLAVLPDYQRRGIAAVLAIACEEALRAEGIGILCAQLETGNHSSAALFEHLGYALYPIRYYRKPIHPEV